MNKAWNKMSDRSKAEVIAFGIYFVYFFIMLGVFSIK